LKESERAHYEFVLQGFDEENGEEGREKREAGGVGRGEGRTKYQGARSAEMTVTTNLAPDGLRERSKGSKEGGNGRIDRRTGRPSLPVPQKEELGRRGEGREITRSRWDLKEPS